MNLQQIQQALREFRVAPLTRLASAILMRRVAMRWLLASAALEYDRMIRLQVLEGVAGVPFRTWFGKSAKGIAAASAYFTKEGTLAALSADPRKGWLALGDTGTFALLRGIIRKHIIQFTRGKAIDLDPMEVIHSGLFGVPLDPSEEYTNVEKLYSVGKHLKTQILSGMETPAKLIAGMGSMGFRQIVESEVANIVRHKALERETADEGPGIPGIETAAQPLDPDDVWGHLAAWVTDPGDPIGTALRNTLRKAWAGWRLKGKGRSDAGAVMNRWLDGLVERKEAPEQKELAESLGIAKSTFEVNYWRPAWARFARALKSSPNLVASIYDRFVSMGFTDVEINVDRIPSPEEISPKRVPGGTRVAPTVKLATPLIPPF